MRDIFLCDIDGTLSTYGTHRSPYDETKVHLDIPLPTCQVIKSLHLCGYKIIFFSGRTEGCREDTTKWIKDHTSIHPELYMRKSDDRRSDDVVKEELYNMHIKDIYNVVGVFDDRLRVVRKWVELGLFVFNTNQTLKEF